MKLLFCELCKDIISPYPDKNRPRFCSCQKSAVWWNDPDKGHLTVWCQDGLYQHVSILGIHNDLLLMKMKGTVVTKKQMEEIIEDTNNDYYFKTENSLIVRVKKGSGIFINYVDTIPSNWL